MKRVAIFPGSFDPFTMGHYDIVIRGLNLFDEIVIAIGRNIRKERYFPIDLMQEKIGDAFSEYGAIRVVTFDELTASMARKHKAKFLLRGLRNTTDFEYENSIAQINNHLNNSLETVFLITSPRYAFISSSIIREVHRYEGDINDFLPYDL